MKSRNMLQGLIVTFILVFGTAASGFAAMTVTASPSGNGQFVVQGNGFSGVEAIEIKIQYDTTALANPRVTQGNLISGMPMVTSNAPGLLQYAGTDPFPKVRSGSGSLATIAFDTVGNASANVAAAVTLRDQNGSVLSTQTIVVPVTTASAGTGDGSRTGSGGGSQTLSGSGSNNSSNSGSGATPPPPAPTVTANPTYLGTVTMPDAGIPAVSKSNDQASLPAPDAEKIQKQTADAVDKEIAQQVAKAAPQTVTADKNAPLAGSVLGRFQAFKGEKSTQSLIALFRSAMAGNSQQPHLALSDGKTNVKVSVNLPTTSKSEPEFALREAKLVSLNKSGDSTWVIELLPNKGTLEASVIVMVDGKMAELPLTVAPPLAADPKTGEAMVLTEADFAAFLKQRSTRDGAGSGQNSVGKQDYIDDYIYTANFLAQSDAVTTAAEKKPKAVKQ
jgi:hypothetical protein